MIGIFQSVTDFIFGSDEKTHKTHKEYEIEKYLAQSKDRIDLEQREREMIRKGYF